MMSGLAKTATAVLIVGLICLGFAGGGAAREQGREEGERGGVPLYYLQLQDFTATLEEEALRPKILDYTVQAGDCLSMIAAEFGTDLSTLIHLNELSNPGLIYPGDRLEILTVAGCVHDVVEGDTLAAIARSYGVEERAILQANEIENPATLPRGERIIVPGGVISRGALQPSFRWPLQGNLTSGYGWRGGKFHYGIDIGAPYGSTFRAAAAGRVAFVGYRGSYGILIEVDHGAGFRTRYAHAGKVLVSAGQRVKAGQRLGSVGMTGNTTGPHLHFEIHDGGEKVNPLRLLN